MKKKKKNTVFEDVLASVTKYFAVLVVIVILIICLSGIRIVNSGEVALILRFGKLVGDTYEEQVHGAGLLFAFPYVIDEVITVPVGTVMEQTVTTHYTRGEMYSYDRNGYVITGDRNIAVISASVKYSVSDPVAYALTAADVPALINSAVSSAMIDGAAKISADELLTTGKDAYAAGILRDAQEKLHAAGVGVSLGTVELTTVSMPEEVRQVYELVNSASVRAATLLEQARQYRENLIPTAEAKANTLISEANSAHSSAIAAASSDLTEFWGVLDEYNSSPEIVSIRIYNEKLSGILSSVGKIRLVDDSDAKIIIN